MSKLCRSVRGGRLGSVGTNCPRLCLLWEAVRPIRRHCTPSDRVYRDVTGVALPGLGSLDAGMCSASEETRVQACNR